MAEQTQTAQAPDQIADNSPQQNQQPEQQPAIDLTALQSQLAASQQLSEQYRQAGGRKNRPLCAENG